MKRYKPSMYNITVTKIKERYLVYNPLVKKPLTLFTTENYRMIFEKEEVRVEDVGEEVFEKLIDMGYIVPLEEDESEKFQAARRLYMFNLYPVVMQFLWAPTMRCNYYCVYCFEEGRCEEVWIDEKDLDDIFIFFTSTITQNPNCKKVELVLFGGEPTLVTDKICSLTGRLKKFLTERGIGFSCSMVTNGYLLNRTRCLKLKEAANLDVVQITIDGLEETYMKMKRPPKDAFEKVLNNIDEIADLVKVRIRVNIDHTNKEEGLKLYEYLMRERNLENKVQIYFAKIYDSDDVNNMSLKEYNVYRAEILEMIRDKKDFENFNYYIPQTHVTSCAALQREFVCIGADKKLYRCEHTLGHPEFAIGDIYNGKKETEFEKKFMNDPVPEKCKQCAYYPLCLRGCPYDRIFRGIQADCEAIKEKIRLDIMALYYQTVGKQNQENE